MNADQQKHQPHIIEMADGGILRFCSCRVASCAKYYEFLPESERPKLLQNAHTDQQITGRIYCPNCDTEVKQDKNSFQCHKCKMLWPKGFGHEVIERTPDQQMRDIDRTHEECAECALEIVWPPLCKGHAAGPVPCSLFQQRFTEAIQEVEK